MSIFVWLDLETTGLNPETDSILEVAAIIAKPDFEEIAMYQAVIGQPPAVLNGMDEYCKKMHTDNGLIKNCLESKLPLHHVERNLCDMLNLIGSTKNETFLAGNSIHFDRSFIKRYMTELDERLSYRMLDVSSLKIAWSEMLGIPSTKKPPAHRALDDVRTSIAEYKELMSMVEVKVPKDPTLLVNTL